MRGEVHDHLVVNVEPLGVVIHALHVQGDLDHVPHGRAEVGKLVVAVEFLVHESPATEFRTPEGSFDGGVGKPGGGHVAVLQVRGFPQHSLRWWLDYHSVALRSGCRPRCDVALFTPRPLVTGEATPEP